MFRSGFGPLIYMEVRGCVRICVNLYDIVQRISKCARDLFKRTLQIYRRFVQWCGVLFSSGKLSKFVVFKCDHPEEKGNRKKRKRVLTPFKRVVEFFFSNSSFLSGRSQIVFKLVSGFLIVLVQQGSVPCQLLRSLQNGVSFGQWATPPPPFFFPKSGPLI